MLIYLKTHENAKTDVAPAEQQGIEIENLVAEATATSGTVPMPSTLSDGTVWKLLNNTEIDVSSGDANQIIYVTYQDPNDPGNNKTMQVLSNLVSIFVEFSLKHLFISASFFLLIEWFRLYEYGWHF